MKRAFSFLGGLLLAGLFFSPARAQDLTGIWRGYFITESGDNYKFEIQIKQNRDAITGVSYSYLNTSFYGKATLTGKYNKGAQTALIREIKTVELRMSGGSQACIMRCIFSYSRSGKEEFLEGNFTSKFERDGLYNRKGENCGGGKVVLRRVVDSDFYIEPFLRPRKDRGPVKINEAPPIPKKTTTTPPPVKKPVTPPVKPPLAKTPPRTNPPVVKNPATPPLPRKDSSVVVKPIGPERKTPLPVAPPPPVLQNRQNELVKVLTVNNPEVLVRLYDNGEIDGDTISVYLDNRLVLSARRLTAAPLEVRFQMEDDNSTHELTMVAENLGRIPPNTSLMIVTAGDQRFEVRITSTEQKNAVVRFRYQPPR